MLPIIIDTDPGVDDALAIMFAIQKNMPILGITTVYGYNSVENSTKNALTILSIMNSSIPVFEGARSPFVGNGVFANCQGVNGLGGFDTTLKSKKQKESALEFFIQILERQKIDIVCLGPLTNIAMLGIIRPDLLKNINRLIILGGVFCEVGNKSPLAEFNAINDPYSFAKVLSFDVPRVIIPADVCRKVLFRKEDFDNIKNQGSIRQIISGYIDYYQNVECFSGGVMYDVLATIYLSNPEFFVGGENHVDIEYNEGKCFGQTFIDKNKKKNSTLILDVYTKKVKDYFLITILGTCKDII